MATGDILLYTPVDRVGTVKMKVTSGTTASIHAGELVLTSLGSPYVTVWTAGNSAKPVVATDYVAGLAMSASTETASAAGYVEVLPLIPGVIYLGNPDTAATWDTQAEYDLLVGDRVLLACSAGGVQTVLATDGAGQGLIVEPLDVSKYPGKVAFSLRYGLSPLA